MKTIKIMVLIGLFLLSGVPTVSAYELFPMSLILEEQGRQSHGVFRIRNTTPRPLTIEVSAAKRVFQDGYYDDLVDADEDFMLMPPQAYIEPGRSQVFRVRYLGNEQLTQAVGYRIRFHQLPVDLAPITGTGVHFLLNINAPVYVVPNSLVAQSAELVSDVIYDNTRDFSRLSELPVKHDNPYGLVRFVNRGAGLTDLATGLLRLNYSNGESVDLMWRDFAPAVTIRHLLPDGESLIPVELIEFDHPGHVVSAEFIAS